MPKGIRCVRGYSEKTLLKTVRQSISNRGSGDYITFLRSMLDDDLIIIDDIGSSGHTVWREEVILDSIDIRYADMMPTVFTSNLSEEQLYEIYGQRIASRLLAKENIIVDLFDHNDLRQIGL